MRFSLDIDGVVADYRKGLRDVAAQLGIQPQTQPLGIPPEELDALMSERQEAIHAQVGHWIVQNIEEFYGGLDCLAQVHDFGAINLALSHGHELFWVSNRGFGDRRVVDGTFMTLCASVTANWLRAHSLPVDEKHLLLTYDKASAIRGSGIQSHLDDIVPHVTQVALTTEAKVYLLRRPWNQRVVLQDEETGDFGTTAAAFGVPEVYSIAEYVSLATGVQV